MKKVNSKFDAYRHMRQWAREDGQKRSGAITLAPSPSIATGKVFRGERRDHLVHKVIDILKDWRSSPFENEGAVRAGLRQSLCLEGVSWRRADHEAEELVANGLRRIGANRPSYEEGQREYPEPRENCSWCGIEVPEEMLATNRQVGFCSEKCARSALDHRNLAHRRNHSRAYADAWDVIQRARHPAKQCERCSKPFRPLIAASKFCSLECSAISQRTRPERQCPRCGTTFRSSRKIFCSNECSRVVGFTTRYERRCKWCCTRFEGKVPSAQCCSRKCSTAFSNFKSGARVPKVLTGAIFDYVFGVAA
jgi:hypothetical protein